jgi:phage FluMu protein Com
MLLQQLAAVPIFCVKTCVNGVMVTRCTFCGKVYILWQGVHSVARCTFCGKVYILWQRVHSVARCTFCGKVYILWQGVHSVLNRTERLWLLFRDTIV